MERVDGKTALVTGASRGIGRAIAIELAREGAKVAINYSSSDAKAKEVTEEITNLGGTAIFYKANIGSSKEARAMVEHVAKEFGRLDILVNNAGITRDSFAAMGQANYSASKGGLIAFTRTAALELEVLQVWRFDLISWANAPRPIDFRTVQVAPV